MEVKESKTDISIPEASHRIATEYDTSSWNFEHIPPESATIRGGGCIASTLCDTNESARVDSESALLKTDLEIRPDQDLSPSTEPQEQKDERIAHTSWPGWAELENDPEIFTILLQEWGMRNFMVNEVYDISELLGIDSSSIFGLIFLSRYVPTDQSHTTTPSQPTDAITQPPWFANQISKFSCGTVALMNILMNIKSADIDLSEALSNFKTATTNMNAKHRGIALDNHAQFRDIHNSFSTKLDQYIVDVMLKEEANKAKRSAQAQARNATKKRKRVTFTKRKKQKQTYEEEEENGFHFVAYISAHGNVWKLDGLRAEPRLVGPIEEGQTWLNVTVQDVLPLLEEALSDDQQCTMMSVVRSEGAPIFSEEERMRKQDDWAPFIETLIRIHAERGDLREMLGLGFETQQIT